MPCDWAVRHAMQSTGNQVVILDKCCLRESKHLVEVAAEPASETPAKLKKVAANHRVGRNVAVADGLSCSFASRTHGQAPLVSAVASTRPTVHGCQTTRLLGHADVRSRVAACASAFKTVCDLLLRAVGTWSIRPHLPLSRQISRCNLLARASSGTPTLTLLTSDLMT